MFFLVAIIFFLLGFALANSFYLNKVKQQKVLVFDYLNSILGLSISHLHDAANFFGLLKLSLNEKDIQHSYNFCKGAAFHFRSIFEELKNNFNHIDKLNFDFQKTMSLLYQKESVDLKDLIELELFQLSNFSRIKFIDSSNSEHALVWGNFNLLSKTLINLIENALKYTSGEIKIELKESNNNWLIKVISFGSEIPLEIATQIETMRFQDSIGHGLSSLASIINFHHGKIEINSFSGEGSSIKIYLAKLNNFNKESKAQIINPKETRKKSKSNLKIYVYLLIIFIAIALGFTFYQNLESSKSEKPVKVQKRILKSPRKEIKRIQTHNIPKPARKFNNEKQIINKDQLIDLIDQQDQEMGLDFDF